MDDVWSLFYVLIEFLRGWLPWRKEKEKERIGDMKQKQHTAHLVVSLPAPCLAWFEHLHSLDYADRPDYQLLQSHLKDLFDCSGDPEDVPFDWDQVNDPSELGTESHVLGTSAGTAGLKITTTTGRREEEVGLLSDPSEARVPNREAAVEPLGIASAARRLGAVRRPDVTRLRKPKESAVVDLRRWSEFSQAKRNLRFKHNPPCFKDMLR